MERLRSFISRWFGRGATEAATDSPPDRLIVGLGNPGARYAGSRHNAGFLVLDRLAERRGGTWVDDASLEARVTRVHLDGRACLLLEPQTFMNASGRSVERALDRWPGLVLERDLLVVYDDLDLPPGRIRLRPSGGGGGHNGIGDVLEVLDTKQVPRLRFGVGRPGPSSGQTVIEYVLAPFEEVEWGEGIEAAIDRAADAVEAVCSEGIRPAMERFNARG